ncbi:MAG TPA: hypothetical protein IGS31_20985 [Oscillatoriales cyanobacterium M4454_W2019_049]|nr:hypothetical protein [Oscillatoriales cyanobacterium M4454_W2019_049]
MATLYGTVNNDSISGNWGGSSATDTAIHYGSDWVGLVLDRTTFSSRNFRFV